MKQSEQSDCIVFGGSLVEQVVHVPRLPKPRQDNVSLTDMYVLPGGSGANVAVYLARLGASVRMLDRWGNDAEADQLEKALINEGVDIRFCHRQRDLLTSFMIILALPDQDWTGITRIPDTTQIGPEDFPLETLASAKFVHFHGFSLGTNKGRDGVEWAIKAAKRQGVKVSLDACTPVAVQAPEVFRHILPCCDLFFANTVEAHAITGYTNAELAAKKLQSFGPAVVLIKSGRHGCYYLEAGEGCAVHCPAIPTTVVDTVGAGDAVVAGVIAGLLRNHNVTESVRLGMATASLVCQGVGAQSHRFNREVAYQLAELSREIITLGVEQ